MRRLTSIVAVNSEGVIGAGNTLPWRVRSDLKFFRETTVENVVIMGRRTYDSLGAPLPNRRNIVVTHGFALFRETPNCRAAGSIDEALVLADNWATKRMDVFVVGGASMYEQFAPYVDRYLITEIDKDVPEADTFFAAANVGDPDGWKVKLVKSGLANGSTDEADFKIFEFLRKDSTQVSAMRERVIAGWQNKRAGNSLHAEFSQLRAAG